MSKKYLKSKLKSKSMSAIVYIGVFPIVLLLIVQAWRILAFDHLTCLTNKNTVFNPEPENTFYFTARLYSYLFSAHHMISLTNENTVLLWRRGCFLDLKQLRRSWFWNARILHTWTINQRTMVFPARGWWLRRLPGIYY